MANDAFAAKFEELRRTFHAQLPERITEMGALLRDGDIAAVQAIAHRIAGQGGTFGLPEISEAAAAVEDAGPDELPAALAALARLVQDS